MYTTRVTLPDGTVITSGLNESVSVQSYKYKEIVNESTDLTLGSVCSSSVEITFFCSKAFESILSNLTGVELKVERISKSGAVTLVGFFTTEEPIKRSANVLQIVAYDRISKLDQDLTTWLAGLGQWPYTLLDFANMVCDACGLSLANTELLNGDHVIQRFQASNVTGRNILRWIGQVAGAFCRATPEGTILFDWYKDSPLQVLSSVNLSSSNTSLSIFDPDAIISLEDSSLYVHSPNISVEGFESGTLYLAAPNVSNYLYHFQGSLTYKDFVVSPISKLQIRRSQSDLGTVYPPNVAEAVNTYVISNNPLLVADQSSDLLSVAQALYERVSIVQYTPCKVTLPVTTYVHAGDIITVHSRNGTKMTMYVMTASTHNQRTTLECTGNYKRDSSSAVHELHYSALSGKVYNLQLGVEGLKAENVSTAGRLSSITQNVESISTEVAQQQSEVDAVKEDITQIKQDASSIHVSIQSIESNGVSKVSTQTGFTFDDRGMHIRKSNSDVENLIDETGMYVKHYNNIILKANDDGVEAVDINVRNYLKVGNHARFEDYTDGLDASRTACFWL